MANQPFILGTRGSDLALTQANMVQAALEAAGIGRPIEQKIIATIGDKRLDLKLSAPDIDKAVFTKELEEALEAKEIHAAVHSLKDVPTILEDQFKLSVVLPRAPIEDVLVTKDPSHAADGVSALPEGATVATSSVRRHHQLRMLRPDLNLIDIRGNVPTRLRKAATLPEMDATILAHAGLKRLGFDLSGPTLSFDQYEVGIAILPPNLMIPAAGQGAVAIEIRTDDEETHTALGVINHEPTWNRIRLERAFLHLLGAGCQTPVGVHTELFEEDQKVRVKAIVFQDNSEEHVFAEAEGAADNADGLAAQLMTQVRS